MNNAHFYKEEKKTIEDYEKDIKKIERANENYYKCIGESDRKNIFQKFKESWDYGFGESAFHRLNRGIDSNNETIRGIEVIIEQKRTEEIYKKMKSTE